VNGKVLLLLVPTMPDDLRTRLFDRMKSIFPDEFKYMDLSSDNSDNTFPTALYTNYNRYSVQVYFFHKFFSTTY
jgi:hypothetical protein